jgi:hypothetical protein
MIDESLTLKVMTDVPIGMKLSLENLTPYAPNFPRCIALHRVAFLQILSWEPGVAQVLVDRKAIRILQMLLKEKTAMLQGAHKDCAIIICQISYQTDVVAIVEKDATRCLTELVELLDDSDDSVSSYTIYMY